MPDLSLQVMRMEYSFRHLAREHNFWDKQASMYAMQPQSSQGMVHARVPTSDQAAALASEEAMTR
jgi:hypothetical protein